MFDLLVPFLNIVMCLQFLVRMEERVWMQWETTVVFVWTGSQASTVKWTLMSVSLGLVVTEPPVHSMLIRTHAHALLASLASTARPTTRTARTLVV